MNAPLTDDLFTHLQGAPMRQLGQQLGIGPAQLAGALSAALPLLLGALGHNARQPQGAQSLFGALEQDHRGQDPERVLSGALDSGPSLSSPASAQGEKILGHMFGARQPRAEQSLGEATGLGPDKSKALLRLLAPVVLAFLAKRMFDQRQAAGAAATPAAAPSPQVLGDVLGQEHEAVRQQGGLPGGLLGAVLDRDGDGKLGLGDLLRAGSGMLGGTH